MSKENLGDSSPEPEEEEDEPLLHSSPSGESVHEGELVIFSEEAPPPPPPEDISPPPEEVAPPSEEVAPPPEEVAPPPEEVPPPPEEVAPPPEEVAPPPEEVAPPPEEVAPLPEEVAPPPEDEAPPAPPDVSEDVPPPLPESSPPEPEPAFADMSFLAMPGEDASIEPNEPPLVASSGFENAPPQAWAAAFLDDENEPSENMSESTDDYDPEEDGNLKHEKDGGWILDKSGRHTGKADKTQPLTLGNYPMKAGNTLLEGSDYTGDDYDEEGGWVLDKMHLKDATTKKDADPIEIPSIQWNVNAEEGSDVYENDGNWVLEKERGSKPKLPPVPRPNFPSDGLNVYENDGNWVLEKVRGSKSQLTPVPKIDLLANVNTEEGSNVYENDGNWKLEKLRVSKLEISGITKTSQVCREYECDEDIKPFYNIARKTLAAYDALTACDTLLCNECDPPDYPEEQGIISWVQDFITELFTSEEEDINANPNISMIQINNDKPPCS